MNRQALLFRCFPARVSLAGLIACALLLAACSDLKFDYLPPTNQANHGYRPGQFVASVDNVWSASLKAVEANEQWILALAERDMGLIVIELANPRPPSDYVDCGLIDGKEAVEAFRGAVKKTVLMRIYLGKGSTKLRVQSEIRLSAEGSDQTRVRVDSTYDLHVDTAAWNRFVTTYGYVFSRNWSFATGGESTQAFGSYAGIESITCRPTHALERRLLQDIEELLTDTS